MTWSEKLIARAVATQVLHHKCLVLIDNCNWTGHECDVLGVTRDLRIIDVEVKISRADLKADYHKGKWWERHWGHNVIHGPEQLFEYPRKVWKHYYALPREIWKPELEQALPSPASGILLFWKQSSAHSPLGMRVERRAKANRDAHRLSPSEVIDIARLGNLRMWEAYKRLEDQRAEANRIQTQGAA